MTDQLYATLAAAQQRFTEARAAYETATRDRVKALQALKAAGETYYRLGKAIGLSTTRVQQLVEGRRKGGRAADDTEEKP